MRMSRLFLRTLRDDPADADIDSHRLLLRAGCIRQVASGIYAWLPLGQRVLAKVAQIVREEMDAAGAQESDAADRAAARALGPHGSRPGVRAADVPARRPQGGRVLPCRRRRKR